MKNTFIHHKIMIKSGNHPMIDYKEQAEGVTPKEWMFIIQECWSTKEDQDAFLWGFEYDEAMIGSRRDLTQKEYKQIIHYQRFESWEFDKTHDNAYSSEYEPQYNPGGGPYHLES